MLQRFREPVSGLTHLAGALLAGGGLVWLVMMTYPQVDRLIVAAIYGISTLLTFLASTIMHLYTGDKRVLKWLIRLDHAAIYVMIAGSYTPIAYVFLDSIWFWGLMLTIWGMALGGVAWKLYFWKKDTIWSLLYYLAMGWLCVLLIPHLLPNLDIAGITLFLLGGLAYTVGAVVFGLKWPNLNRWWGYHEIWHIFVLAGAGFHFFGIAHYLA